MAHLQKISHYLILYLIFLVSVCASLKHEVICTSSPSGAKVTISNQSCITPCTINLPFDSDACSAEFQLPDEQKELLNFPPLPGLSGEIAKSGTHTCYVMATPLFAVSIASLFVAALLDEGDAPIDDEDKDDLSDGIGLFSLGCAVTGGIFYFIGRSIEIEPYTLHAVFYVEPSSKPNNDEENNSLKYNDFMKYDNSLFPKDIIEDLIDKD